MICVPAVTAVTNPGSNLINISPTDPEVVISVESI